MDLEHGKDGWTLTKYDWDEETGRGDFRYERVDNGIRMVEHVSRQQPLYPWHAGFVTS